MSDKPMKQEPRKSKLITHDATARFVVTRLLGRARQCSRGHRRSGFWWASLLVAGTLSTPTAFACELSVRSADSVNLTGSRKYDVFDGSSAVETFRIEVQRLDSGLPDVSIGAEQPTDPNSTIDSGTGPISGSGTEATNLSALTVTTAAASTCGALLRVAPQGNARATQAGEDLAYRLVPLEQRATSEGQDIVFRVQNLMPDETVRLEYQVQVPAEQFVTHGTYRGELLASVRPTDNSIANDTQTLIVSGRDATRRIPVTIDVGTAARISLAGTQGRKQRVDFGELRQNGQPMFPVELIVQASSPYVLRFRSDNNGRLHQAVSGRSWYVPYELRAGSELVILEHGETRVAGDRRTSAEGQRIPLNFRITDVTNKRAGTYVDRLTVEITPTALGF